MILGQLRLSHVDPDLTRPTLTLSCILISIERIVTYDMVVVTPWQPIYNIDILLGFSIPNLSPLTLTILELRLLTLAIILILIVRTVTQAVLRLAFSIFTLQQVSFALYLNLANAFLA